MSYHTSVGDDYRHERDFEDLDGAIEWAMNYTTYNDAVVHIDGAGCQLSVHDAEVEGEYPDWYKESRLKQTFTLDELEATLRALQRYIISVSDKQDAYHEAQRLTAGAIHDKLLTLKYSIPDGENTNVTS